MHIIIKHGTDVISQTMCYQKYLFVATLPALLAVVKPIGPTPAEAEGCGTGEGFAIHPARDVGRAPGVG